jgi:hypothetical protein
MFGGAVFALGNETSLSLERVAMTNNSAAAGGAVATLGGSAVTCSEGCRFAFNRAKVSQALRGQHDQGSDAVRVAARYLSLRLCWLVPPSCCMAQ